MNKKQKLALDAFTLVLVIIGVVGLFRYYGRTLPKLETGAFRIVEQETGLSEQARKLLASEDQIIVFFENEGYAAVYTPEGSFSYGIQVDSSDRGSGKIAWIDGQLVIKSKNNTFYFFDGKTLTDQFRVNINENTERTRALESEMGEDDSLSCETSRGVVSVSGRKVVETDASGAERVLFTLPNKTIHPLVLISFFSGTVLIILSNRRERALRAKTKEPAA